MRIALICPHFPPDRCGVGDYTAQLAAELAAQGNEVAVWTAQLAPAPVEGFALNPVAAPWNRRALREIGDAVAAWSPDAINLQYTPYLYGPRSLGLAPGLPAWIRRLRARTRRPVAVTAHELHYPIGATPDRFFVGTPQLLQFLALLRAADAVLFTYEIPYLRYSRAFPWARGRLAWVPVGANIAPELVARAGRPTLPKETALLLQGTGIPERHRLLIQFGTDHPSRLTAPSLAALEAARRELGPDSVTLAFLGASRESIDGALRAAGRMDLQPWVRALGYQAPWQASLWLRRADVVLAPYVDGISTRRSSVMAALAHARPIVTTRGNHTERSLDWSLFTDLVPAEDEQPFARAAASLLTDEPRARRLSEAAQQAYAERFSWPVIARRIVSELRRMA